MRAELTRFTAELILRLAVGDDARHVDVEEALRIRDDNAVRFASPSAWDAVPLLGKTLLRSVRLGLGLVDVDFSRRSTRGSGDNACGTCPGPGWQKRS
jgi:hypothetical protein